VRESDGRPIKTLTVVLFSPVVGVRTFALVPPESTVPFAVSKVTCTWTSVNSGGTYTCRVGIAVKPFAFNVGKGSKSISTFEFLLQVAVAVVDTVMVVVVGVVVVGHVPHNAGQLVIRKSEVLTPDFSSAQSARLNVVGRQNVLPPGSGTVPHDITSRVVLPGGHSLHDTGHWSCLAECEHGNKKRRLTQAG
jgi:hypothetical protein